MTRKFHWIRSNLYVRRYATFSTNWVSATSHASAPAPLDPDNCVIIGRARTFRWMETDYVVHDDPYGLEIEVWIP